MKKILIILILLIPFLGVSQVSSNQNYIEKIVYLNEYTKAEVSANQNINKITNVEYVDGLGRPIQNVGVNAGGQKQDIITHIAYDDLGRPARQYLPYAKSGNNGTYRASALTETNNFYNSNKYENTLNPYSETFFDNSPLNLTTKVSAPGNAWKEGVANEHTIKKEYKIIQTEDEVYNFSVAINDGIPSLVNNGLYLVGQYPKEVIRTPTLYKLITKNENWKPSDGFNNTIQEFKSFSGKLLLKRTFNNNVKYDTYYVYDNTGRLTFVISPKVDLINGVSNQELSELCYQYRYDIKNRVIEKKIPGKGWESIVYNNLDQPILTQDANLKAANKWLFVKYDGFGRVVYTGIDENNSKTRTQLQAEADAFTTQYEDQTSTTQTYGGTTVKYTNKAYPTSFDKIYTVNYYDNYDFIGLNNIPSNSFLQPLRKFYRDLKGLATGSKVLVLGTNNWISSVSGYDSRGRLIYLESTNDYLGTKDVVETKLDFTGKPLKVKTTHLRNNKTTSTLDVYTYDHMGRVLTLNQCIGDQTMEYSCAEESSITENLSVSGIVSSEKTASKSITVKQATLKSGAVLKIIPSNANTEAIVENVYDELGQLVTKKVGGGLQTVDYAYNIRGWLKSINQDTKNDNDLFNFVLRYNTPTTGTPLFNGNISQTSWGTLNNDKTTKTYTYEYDALNRLTNATDNLGHYTVSNITYDKNGNIETLNRKGHTNTDATTFGLMDKLTYIYDSGNKLLSVTDAINTPLQMKGEFKDGNKTGNDFAYDANGNMLKDLNKGIGEVNGITYNLFNLPIEVQVDKNSNKGTISYIYDASGVKLQKKVHNKTKNTTTITDYAGNYVYENGSLKFFNHAEGYINAENGGYEYVYQYKDHLGNVRLSYQDADNNGSISASTEIVEEKNYYPFGLVHKGYNSTISSLGNSVAKKFGYNGVELEEALGVNLNEMDVRAYDSALARFTSIDPVEHHSQSTFTAFDNNPVFWKDPSGADSESTDDFGGTVDKRSDEFFNGVTFYGGGISFDGEVFSASGFKKNESSGSECPSCKTKEDWFKYYDQLQNTADSMGYDSIETMAYLNDHIVIVYTEKGKILYVNGKVVDLSVNENRLAVFGQFFMPFINVAPQIIARIFGAKSLVSSVSGAKTAARSSSQLARYSGILRDAAKLKGNFGLGRGTASEALELGKAWVGKGYRVSGNGKAWISSDGLRQFRPPTYKSKLGIDQANFQWRNINRGGWQGNGHLDVFK
ncbi:MAG: DUF6443 domain-containing protein [Cellulophaga sp.]